MKAIAAVLVTALAFTGCKKSDENMDMRAQAVAAGSGAGSGAGAADKGGKAGLGGARPADTRKVIRTGHVELVVATYAEARAKLDAMLESVGGYVDSTQVNRRASAVSDAVLVLRIPADAFASVVPQLRELGEVTSEMTNATDITDQYVDTAARIASATQLEKRLLELATDRGGNIEQVLAVERELARVRGEIEADQGHIKQWSDQIALSTLTVTLSTKRAEIAPTAPATLGSRTSDAFHGSIEALGDLGAWLVVHGIAALPWLLVLTPGGVLLRRLARRRAARLPAAVLVPPAT